MLTALGTSPRCTNSRQMRTVSSAMAVWACSVLAPMWWVPTKPGIWAMASWKGAVPPAGSGSKTSRPTRRPFSFIAREERLGVVRGRRGWC